MIARGSWQREILHALDRGEAVWNPVSALRGKAKNYAPHYQRSFNSLLKRMESAGYEVTTQLGPKGGWWGAMFTAKKPVWRITVKTYDVWEDADGSYYVNNTFTHVNRLTIDQYPDTDAKVRWLLRDLGVVMPYQRIIFDWQDEHLCYIDEANGRPLCEVILEKDVV